MLLVAGNSDRGGGGDGGDDHDGHRNARASAAAGHRHKRDKRPTKTDEITWNRNDVVDDDYLLTRRRSSACGTYAATRLEFKTDFYIRCTSYVTVSLRLLLTIII